MKYVCIKRTTNFLAMLVCLGLVLSCGGASEEAEEPGAGQTQGGETDEAAGQSVEEMTDGASMGEVVEESCAEGDVACEDAQGNSLDADEEGDGPDVGAEGEGDEDAEGDDRGADPKLAWRSRVARGKQVFIKRCDFCHPDGTEDTGPKLRGINWPVQKTVSMVRKGKGKMKPMPPAKISSAQMRDLLAYLSTIRAVRGVKRP